jgi:phospholipid transport system substrate-binding protein
MSLLRIGAIALALMLGAGLPARAADPAAAQIQTFYTALLDTMKRGPQLGMQGRFHALEAPVDSTFNVPVMIGFIVGPSWTALAEKDKQALTDSFRRMTIASYAANFSKFDGEQFQVDPAVQQRGPDKIVQTTLTPKGDKPIPLIYRMRETPQGWKIIDVFLEGYVSELATRRSDFGATLASGGPPALETKMDQLTNNLLNGSAKPTQ